MLRLLQLLYILFRMLFKIVKRGSISSVIAENILLRQQLIILSRNKKRCPNLSKADRFIFCFFSQYINYKRLARSAILIKSATLIKLHKFFISGKYRSLFSKKNYKKTWQERSISRND